MPVDQPRTFALILAVLLLAGQATPSLAQSAANSAGAPDERTERRQVRPGCSAMVVPGTVTSDRSFVGGQCPDGLLEGIVIIHVGRGAYIDTYRNGKSVGNGMWVGKNAEGNAFFTVAIRDDSGTNHGSAKCVGSNASERAASYALCQWAARIFGPEIFDESSPLIAQALGKATGAAAPRSSAGDDPKVLGGSFRP